MPEAPPPSSDFFFGYAPTVLATRAIGFITPAAIEHAEGTDWAWGPDPTDTNIESMTRWVLNMDDERTFALADLWATAAGLFGQIGLALRAQAEALQANWRAPSSALFLEKTGAGLASFEAWRYAAQNNAAGLREIGEAIMLAQINLPRVFARYQERATVLAYQMADAHRLWEAEPRANGEYGSYYQGRETSIRAESVKLAQQEFHDEAVGHTRPIADAYTQVKYNLLSVGGPYQGPLIDVGAVSSAAFDRMQSHLESLMGALGGGGGTVGPPAMLAPPPLVGGSMPTPVFAPPPAMLGPGGVPVVPPPPGVSPGGLVTPPGLAGGPSPGQVAPGGAGTGGTAPGGVSVVPPPAAVPPAVVAPGPPPRVPAPAGIAPTVVPPPGQLARVPPPAGVAPTLVPPGQSTQAPLPTVAPPPPAGSGLSGGRPPGAAAPPKFAPPALGGAKSPAGMSPPGFPPQAGRPGAIRPGNVSLPGTSAPRVPPPGMPGMPGLPGGGRAPARTTTPQTGVRLPGTTRPAGTAPHGTGMPAPPVPPGARAPGARVPGRAGPAPALPGATAARNAATGAVPLPAQPAPPVRPGPAARPGQAGVPATPGRPVPGRPARTAGSPTAGSPNAGGRPVRPAPPAQPGRRPSPLGGPAGAVPPGTTGSRSAGPTRRGDAAPGTRRGAPQDRRSDEPTDERMRDVVHVPGREDDALWTVEAPQGVLDPPAQRPPARQSTPLGNPSR
jgi:hypothetical protein